MIDINEWTAKVTNTIAQYGHQLIGVFGTDEEPGPNFTYTIGLYPKHGFELIIVGLQYEIAGMILNSIGAELRAGGSIERNTPDDRWANMPCKFKACGPKVRDYVYQADRFYGKSVPVRQLVVPDKNGVFPDEEGYDIEYMNKRQIILYEQ